MFYLEAGSYHECLQSERRIQGTKKTNLGRRHDVVRWMQVLLLDEPTSALDAESERLVQEALDRAAEGRSVILIAHRLGTIKRADRVLVMQNGRVVESGKHDELLSLGKTGACVLHQSPHFVCLFVFPTHYSPIAQARGQRYNIPVNNHNHTAPSFLAHLYLSVCGMCQAPLNRMVEIFSSALTTCC